VKAATLAKLQQAAFDGACQLFYFDQSGFSASPPVQRGWSPIGEPHRVFPQPHCRRSVLGALDFGANLLTYRASKATIKRPDVVQFLDQIARQSTPGLTTVVVLDNASIHHNLDKEPSTAGFSNIACCCSICRLTAPSSISSRYSGSTPSITGDVSFPGPRRPSMPRSENYSTDSVQSFKSNFREHLS
jgi:hypothetical protein